MMSNNFDRQCNSLPTGKAGVRKKTYAKKNTPCRTVLFRPFIPGASLLRRFAPGYPYPAHTGLNCTLHCKEIK